MIVLLKFLFVMVLKALVALWGWPGVVLLVVLAVGWFIVAKISD